MAHCSRQLSLTATRKPARALQRGPRLRCAHQRPGAFPGTRCRRVCLSSIPAWGPHQHRHLALSCLPKHPAWRSRPGPLATVSLAFPSAGSARVTLSAEVLQARGEPALPWGALMRLGHHLRVGGGGTLLLVLPSPRRFPPPRPRGPGQKPKERRGSKGTFPGQPPLSRTGRRGEQWGPGTARSGRGRRGSLGTLPAGGREG